MARRIKTEYIILGVIGLIALLYFTGAFQFAALPPGVPGVPGGGGQFAVNVWTSGYMPIEGVMGALNAELWNNENRQIKGETAINAALTSLTSTAPSTFNGYIMMGNDNFESTTDKGAEAYYRKYPVSWRDHSGDISFDRIPIYNESTITWTGYDDGTAETTTNITMGSGATVTTTELRIEPSSNAVLGNPEFNRPLAACFNESATGVFEEIRPSQYDEIIPVPGFLSGKNIVKSQCYVIPTTALYEGVSGQPQFYRFYIRMEAKSGKDPVPGDSGTRTEVHAIILDKTYYKDDNQVWQEGWGDESITLADTDIGMASESQTKIIYFT